MLMGSDDEEEVGFLFLFNEVSRDGILCAITLCETIIFQISVTLVAWPGTKMPAIKTHCPFCHVCVGFQMRAFPCGGLIAVLCHT